MLEKDVIEWSTTVVAFKLLSNIPAHDYEIAGTSEYTKTTVNCLGQKHIKFKALGILDWISQQIRRGMVS